MFTSIKNTKLPCKILPPLALDICDILKTVVLWATILNCSATLWMTKVHKKISLLWLCVVIILIILGDCVSVFARLPPSNCCTGLKHEMTTKVVYHRKQMHLPAKSIWMLPCKLTSFDSCSTQPLLQYPHRDYPQSRSPHTVLAWSSQLFLTP